MGLIPFFKERCDGDQFSAALRTSREARAIALRSSRRASLSLALAFFSCSRCRLANVVGLCFLGMAVLQVQVAVVRTWTLAVSRGLGQAQFCSKKQLTFNFAAEWVGPPLQ